MIKKKYYILTAAFLIASTLTVTTIVRYSKNKPNKSQANNSAQTDSSEQYGQAPFSDSLKDLETTDKDTQENLSKDIETTIITYTVKSDDTLESIASTYNITVKSIVESNNLSSNSLLKEGQVLEFPSLAGVLYKIKEGETLWDLAMLNKLDFNKIVEVNKLETPEKLKLGQKIIMPGVDTVKSLGSNTSNIKNVASNKVLNRGGSSATDSKGRLPVRGKISSLYGPRWGRQHEGIDIAAPTGTDVFASMDGKVSFSGWQGGYGNLIIIDHGKGLQSYYAHNSKLLVKRGQTVTKGTHIADVGSTGNSTGPHSHFEIRKNGTAVNPYNYVK
jgi:murein DD-endopeptidase MepM/ murein hydrolase activator NlpD